MAHRFGTLTAAVALHRLQHLLDDVAWSAAQYDDMRGGKPEAGQLDRLAARLQQVIDLYTEDAAQAGRLTLDLDADELAHDAPEYVR